jgi:DNA-directed RNA polymerase subunit RPC12/RpoP
MNQKVKHCARCSGACEMKALGELTAEDAPMKLIVNGMPALVCPKDHKAPINNDFMLWLIQQLRAFESQIPAGKEQGLLFKKYQCGSCGKELASKSDKRQSFPFSLSFEDSHSFTVGIDMPVYKCSGCGKEQVRSDKELHKHIPGATVALNDEAGFPHSG